MKQLLKLAVLLLFLLPGCSSSRITSSWKADNVQPQAFKKIIVLGLIREKERHLRESMEQHLVGELRNLGYDATCSCDEYNPKTFEDMTEEQALAKLKSSGYSRTMYGRIYTEGYYTEDTKYFWETNLYALDKNELLYSAQSQSFDPASTERMGEEHGRMITLNMLKKNVLTNLKEQTVNKAM